MKQIRLLAQYYVDLMVKLGLVRFSLLLAFALVVLAMIVQMAVTLLLSGQVASIDLVRSVFFGLLITPWAVYFLSVVVEQLEESRQRLARLVDQLEEMRHRDLKLNHQLQQNIILLNREISDRIKAEEARLRAMSKLQEEVGRRELAQTELEQKSSFLRSFLDASPDLVFYRNSEQQFSGCNRAVELLTGKSEKQLVGLTPEEVYSNEVAAKIMETDKNVFRYNVSLTYEQWLEYPDGGKACFEIRKVPYYDRVGKRSGLMGFGRDITERKRYQEALESASRDKTTFISTISHELRTPLNGIVGLSRILLDSDNNPERLNYLKTIHVSAITMGNIFNDIIEMDKIERANVQLDYQPLDFIDFIADLENIAGLLVQPKKLTFIMMPMWPLPQKIITDATRLRQILWNLIANAVKFTPHGEIVLRIEYLAGGRLRFEIQDSGIGIPQEEQDKIFAMYYQVKDQYGVKSATGTGIGLAVSRRLAQSMGGDISVQSLPGKGACFMVELGAEKCIDSDEQSDKALPLPALHVLLVEDIELNVVVARSVLEKLGSSVVVAMTGKAALQLFDPEEFDLVLLDIQLPDMTGFDIARTLHQRYYQHHLPPLVALTANVLRDKQAYLDAGIDDVLSKPLAVKALTRVMSKYWGHQDGGDEDRRPGGENLMLLDVDMLAQYRQLAGSELIYRSLEMFEQTMPGYLSALDASMMTRDLKVIVAEGHKIKGAAGTVGLSRLQQLAERIQHSDIPAWWENVQLWIDELKQVWSQDVKVLREWLKKSENK